MKLGLINSAFAQAGKGTAYGIEMTKNIGFLKSVEGSVMQLVYNDRC